MADEAREQFEDRIKQANRSHDQHWSRTEFHGKQVEVYSLAAMRAPALVAAGAIFAAIGFYSANFDHLTRDPAKLASFNLSLQWLVGSLFLITLAPGAAYFSQIEYSKYLKSLNLTFCEPFEEEVSHSRRHVMFGNIWRWIAIILTFCSLGSLAVGGWYFLKLTA